jgi:hypothetical protein
LGLNAGGEWGVGEVDEFAQAVDGCGRRFAKDAGPVDVKVVVVRLARAEEGGEEVEVGGGLAPVEGEGICHCVGFEI